MITGQLMYDIDINAEDDAKVSTIRSQLQAAIKAVDGVTGFTEVDNDLVDDSESEAE
jgi:hypothetical protein